MGYKDKGVKMVFACLRNGETFGKTGVSRGVLGDEPGEGSKGQMW
jgi:hypothetical protein